MGVDGSIESLTGSFSGPLKHLSGNGSANDKSLAALSIALMVNEGTLPDDIETSNAIHDALYAAMREDEGVQINALLAIKGLAVSSPIFPRATSHEQVRYLKTLSTDQRDDRITASAMAALCGYGRLDEDAYRPVIQALFDENILEHTLSLGFSSTDLSVQLACMDCLAALVANPLIDFKPRAFEGNITEKLADFLSQCAGKRGYGEIQLYCLLTLGMVISGDEKGQEYMVSSPSSIKCLMGYMRRHDDADIHILASDIFKLLSSKPHLKEQLSQSMRVAHESAA